MLFDADFVSDKCRGNERVYLNGKINFGILLWAMLTNSLNCFNKQLGADEHKAI